jgi:Flp pilus assembly protein TadG
MKTRHTNPQTTLTPLDSHRFIGSRRSRIRLNRAAPRETGGTLVESAVGMTLLLMVIFGILDCSRALYVDHYVRYAAEEAARYAMVRGATWNNAPCSSAATESCTATNANVVTWVNSITPAGIDSANNLAVATTWSGKTPTGASCTATSTTNGPGCVVQVQVSYNFNFVLPFLPANGILMQSTSAVAISQ